MNKVGLKKNSLKKNLKKNDTSYTASNGNQNKSNQSDFSDKPSILITGPNGLVGSKFTKLFADKYQFDNLDLRHPTQPVDITNLDQVLRTFEQSKAHLAIHLAAYTDVTAAWEQRKDKTGLAWQVNVEGTDNIIRACQQFDKYLIHISTAYVFDGEATSQYTEQDQPNPIEWYGQTKWEAEKLVMDSKTDWTILRIDQPFRSDPFEKTDFAHRIIQGLKQDSLYPMFEDHYFGPTYIEDFARVLNFFIRKIINKNSQEKSIKKLMGVFHASSGEKWSDFDFAQAIKHELNLPGQVKPGTLDKYLKTLSRPYQRNTSLDTSKLKQILDFQLKPVKQAIRELEVE
ncbi:MAG: sugar nucleotide-binding protein [Candidatus Pacebacteria bacterium]|nr:sugar nucleotide-binding protein [Candidatus Paceibacterota bacterium]